MSGGNSDLCIYLVTSLLFDFLPCLGTFLVSCMLSHLSCIKETTDPSTDGRCCLIIQETEAVGQVRSCSQVLMGDGAPQTPKKQVQSYKEWPTEIMIPRSA